MASKNQIGFIVEYEDGSTASMRVSPRDIKTGDHAARIIAGERQQEGTLREGKIKEVRRDGQEAPLQRKPSVQ